MSVQAAVPKDDPMMIAWEAYKKTNEFNNSRRWALYEAHVDGSLCAAFFEGYQRCLSEIMKGRPQS